jgi:hypothetical protein
MRDCEGKGVGKNWKQNKFKKKKKKSNELSD